jgi:hypothetical protein
MCIIMCIVLRFHLKSENRAIEAREVAEGRPKGFRYLL